MATPDETPRPDAPRADADLLRRLQRAPGAEARRQLGQWLREQVAAFLGFGSAEEVAPRDNFLELGLDSLRAVDFKILLEGKLLCALRSTLLFDHPTPETLVRHLADEHLALAPEDASAVAETPEPEAPVDDRDLALLGPEEARVLLARQNAKVRAYERARGEPIAIVGIGCRFPGGATGPDAYWRLLDEGRDAITEIPESRWSLAELWSADRDAPGKMYTRHGGYLDGIERFDAGLFGISPREATQLDPQQRLLLETVWHALEDAGQSADALFGTETGVFIGLRESEYFNSQSNRTPEEVGTYYGTGNALSTAAGRISYVLGLKGPNLAMDTACSSSLLAVHLAVQSLRRGESTAALAGGVNALLDPISNVALCRASMVSPDGRCKTFDAAANGYVRAEGCGIVFLKTLSRALADGDRIHALIRGTAANQDGASGGLTVPHGPSQEAVIRRALADASLAPYQVGYVEAHGTGTSLGDPIEVGALDAVFGGSRLHGAPLVVGSVKTNVGHLETAAGIAGLLKVVLALRHQRIPRHLHLDTPNPHIPWDRTVVKVPVEPIPWERGSVERIAGVSSFGFSGTNVHVVLSEAPETAPRVESAARPAELVALSAATEPALRELATRWVERLGEDDGASLGDLALTAATGRARLSQRIALVADSREDLRRQLAQAAAEGEAPGASGGRAPAQPPAVAFLFTGQGSQRAGMGRELFETQPVFRDAIERCARVLDPLLGRPLVSVLWGDDASLLDETRFTQPALFALETSLAALWASLGVRPAWVAGHSVGEYAAAVAAGVFSLEDGLRLIEARGRIMTERTQPGAMLAVQAAPSRVEPHLAAFATRAAIAVVNGPESVVVSGDHAAIDALEAALARDRIRGKRLAVSHAFHSPMMDPMLEAFAAVARTVAYAPPRIGFVSCLRPGPIGAEIATADYWVEHVRAAVRFHEGALALAREGCGLWCEVGPSPVCLGMARRFVPEPAPAAVATLRGADSDLRSFLRAAGEAWVRGADVDLGGLHRGSGHRRTSLPSYPFQQQRYWLERCEDARRAASPTAGPDTGHPLLGRHQTSSLLGAGEHLFESVLRESDPPWIADHRVFDRAILPGAGFVEMALASARTALGSGEIALRKLVIQSALAIGEKPSVVQTLVAPGEHGRYTVRVASLAPDEGESGAPRPWTVHATGEVGIAPHESSRVEPIAEIRARCVEEVDLAEHAGSFRDVGLGYGPAFQGVVSMRAQGRESLGRIRLPAAAGSAEPFQVHPALLDACFQQAGVLLLRNGFFGTYLPVGATRVVWRKPVGSETECHVVLRPGAPDRPASLDLRLFDATGLARLEIRGLALVRASREAIQRAIGAGGELLHEVSWVAGEAPPGGRIPGSVLVLDGGGLGEELTARLGDAGVPCAVVPSAELEASDAAVLRDRMESLPQPLSVVVHLAALEGADVRAFSEARQRTILGSALSAVQALAGAAFPAPPRLLLVTRGAQAAGPFPGRVDAEAASLWGLGATIALEHPEFRCTRVDLDPLRDARDVDRLRTELGTSDGEDRIAWRGDDRLVARLGRVRPPRRRLALPPTDSIQLRASEWGVLENLRIVPRTRRAPGPGEVEIDVDAAALNFKDPLWVLGLLRDVSERAGIHRAADQPLGLDAAGVVVGVGEGVTEWSVGDEVVTWTFGALASHVTVPAEIVTRRPAALRAEQAAALPTVMLTAVYGLLRLARLQRGESVLVHAAAGGVGQAALQIARRAGARVFATASRGKHAFLRRQGIAHVFDSRALGYAAAIREATGGRGVDVVLNSLGGDHVAESLRALAEGGRFVEIGRLGAWSEERLAAERPDIASFRYDVADVVSREPALFRSMFEEIHAGFADGSLTAPIVDVRPLEDAVAAFTDLAQGRTAGKVVLTVPRRGPASGRALVRPDRTYVVTGGLGALGLVVARWLVAQGARHLVLAGRGAPGDAARAALAEMEAAGATVRAEAAGVGDRAQARRLVERVEAGGPPVGGLVHAAGVLDDGVLLRQTPERFASVLRPKVSGAAHLLEALAGQPLDLVVFFSSMASLLGSAGQSSYAAANAVLDAMAHDLRARGIRGTSIQWGPWSGAGMAAAVAERNAARFAEMGLSTIDPAEGVEALASALASERPTIAVLPIRWPKFLASLRGPSTPPFFGRLGEARRAEAPSGPSIADRLAAAKAEERPALLAAFLREQLARVLGFASPDAIDPSQPFVELGVDSLLAVDYRNRVEAALSRSLPATLLFDHPTLSDLVAHLAHGGAAPSSTEEALLARVEELSEEEARRLVEGGEADGRPV